MAAVIYDALLLLAVLFLATVLALPFNDGQAYSAEQAGFTLYLLMVAFFFYGWFWTHGGQTLGMKSWKLRLANMAMQPIGWRQAACRFIAALLSWGCLGMGFFWCLIDKNGLCWHDYLSKTRLFGPK